MALDKKYIVKEVLFDDLEEELNFMDQRGYIAIYFHYLSQRYQVVWREDNEHMLVAKLAQGIMDSPVKL